MANDIATAYVSVLPTVKSQSLDKAKSDLGKKLAGVTSAIVAGVGASISAVVAGAVSSYADFEQFQGGISKIFGDGADEMVKQTQGEYAKLGLSMNQAQETILSFASSLKKSGGDMNNANTILTDMADNSSIFGTDLQSLQNAYAGFAKGQFNMLDNLKLGYGGSATEMQKLLDDAEKISGVKYDISNFKDVTEAIHIIQEEQNIAGNSAKEASKTIAGSLASVKANWQNLLTGFATGDVSEPLNNLMESATNLASNIMPIIQQVLTSIGTMLSSQKFQEILNGVFTMISNLIPTFLPQVLNAVMGLFNGLFNALPTMINGIMKIIPKLLNQIISAITSLLPKLMNGIGNLLQMIATNLPKLFLTIVNKLPELIKTMVTTLLNNLPTIVKGITEIIKNIIKILPSLVKSIFTLVVDLMKSPDFWRALGNAVISLLEMVINLPIMALNGLLDMISMIPGVDIPHLPEVTLPKLANGGIVTTRTIAEIGEAGPEAVIPLNKFNEFGNNQNIVIQMDEVTLQDANGTFLGKLKNINNEQIFINNVKMGLV